MANFFLCSSSQGVQNSCFVLLVCSSLLLLPLSKSVYFEFTEFPDDQTSVLCSGDAKTSRGNIQFNKVNNSLYRVGHVNYPNAVQIWDRKSEKLTDFVTHFTFIIETQPPKDSGHGFTFFLAPVGFEIPPNSGAGYLGLFNSSYPNSSLNKILFVEFDSYPDRWDPPFEHVGINKNWLGSVAFSPWNSSLHSGDPADAWVSYNSTTQMLSLSWRYGKFISTLNTSLSYQVDLREVLPEWVTIGFSAATGRAMERHILQYWEFNSSLNIVDKKEDTSKKMKLSMGLAVPLSVVAVGGLVTCAIFWRRENKRTKKSLDKDGLPSINDDLERGAGPKRFSFKDLILATNNFSDDQKLGEGGFGCVYKGYLSREGMVVAVKKISQGSRQGKKEYMTEVKIISSLRHRNLVQLIGWCHDQTQFLLVYEFLPNGSLDSHLFFKKSTLPWTIRYKIALGLASALLYLHEECERCVVHRDIKSSNIMLDSGFNVKLGDFGLARHMDHEHGLQTTALAGTLGYICPEYVTTGKASKESDVYSFGVVALEIACGRKATDKVDPSSYLGLVQWVWGLFEKGELLSYVDTTLNKEFDMTEVERLMMVGLWCSHPDRSMRPSIRQAIHVLKFEATVPKLPLKMPIPLYYTAADVPQISSGGATMSTTSIDLVR
ncbi:L-type lectin-domain containing receptor kinase IX.1 [Lactuca sativa]|uniref:L-type lectin-domain containing receptor kinase IX.1 n=1 Tax=Lactuca sativa TaxID=4236 RepID=UPI000CBAF49A|nr:L-type lectin-domain containing receptor kinase IX.1 [Lactuca sativa]